MKFCGGDGSPCSVFLLNFPNWSQLSHCSQFIKLPYYEDDPSEGLRKAHNIIFEIAVVSLIISSFCRHYFYGNDEGRHEHITYMQYMFSSILQVDSREGRRRMNVRRVLRPCKFWFPRVNDDITWSIMLRIMMWIFLCNLNLMPRTKREEDEKIKFQGKRKLWTWRLKND